MSLDRVPELVEFYGHDVVLLIGGELHRDGDPRGTAERFRALVDP
jgi:ribulose-bisphosphate carboxylase large chain